MRQLSATVTANGSIAEGLFELSFPYSKEADIPVPGQFITIRVSNAVPPLLRRPFAFSDWNPNTRQASIVFQKRGAGTEILAGKTTGDALDIIGPLGNSFQEPGGKGRAIIVAGGIGLGPMLFLADHLHALKRDVIFVYGCAHGELVPTSSSFTKANAVVCTDDGSRGFHGTNVDYVKTLSEKTVAGATLYCCGPHAMMKACHELAQQRGIPCYVSMEQVMACGVGACMGCVVKVKGGKGFARVCADGPVFDSREIEW